MRKKKKDHVYGWWQHAGHRWPIKEVRMEQGVMRIVASGYTVNDVPDGVGSATIYGADGAMVFRLPAVRHDAMHGGLPGEFTLDFYMRRDVREIEDSNLEDQDISTANWFEGATLAVDTPEVPTRRYGWYVAWRSVALVAMAAVMAWAVVSWLPAAMWWVSPVATVATLCGVLWLEHAVTSKGKP